MDQIKTGKLIGSLRRSLGLTQKRLAEQIGVSDKAVSKWERGQGAPDTGVLPALSDALGVPAEKLLSGELAVNPADNGDLRKLKFCVCPVCGAFSAASPAVNSVCCGRRLMPLTVQKPDADHAIRCERIENEWYLTGGHPMTKAHSIRFAALLTDDTLVLHRFYPEWDLSARLYGWRGILLWYCNRHGLFGQKI